MTIWAGMPRSAKVPVTSMPGVVIVTLIGSSMQKPSVTAPNPCHGASGSKRPTAGLGGKQIVGCLREGVLDPLRPGRAPRSGCQTPKNQPSSPSRSAIARASVTTRLRKSIASRIDSSVSVAPLGPSIIAAATSSTAIIG